MSLSAAALAAMQSTAAAQGPAEHTSGHGGPMMECAGFCSDCQQECDACATHCAVMLANGRKEHLETLQMCRDCADVCSAAAQICARGGPMVALICGACAEACVRCGNACDKLSGDVAMKRCAEMCRICEKACRAMIKQAEK